MVRVAKTNDPLTSFAALESGLCVFMMVEIKWRAAHQLLFGVAKQLAKPAAQNQKPYA
jgi:hypothetical protein